MNYIQKIKRLYNLSESENFGFSEVEIQEIQEKLETQFPLKIKEYYLELGKQKSLNYSYNRLLKPDTEIGFSDNGYLVFYEENQVVAFWGIKTEDLKLDNPPVWVNYDTIEKSGWILETKTTENFFLLMAVCNGTLGGLQYNGNFFGDVDAETVKCIEKHWASIEDVSTKNQKVYTNDYKEVISLCFDDQYNCNGVFIGTSDQERFDTILDRLDLDWSYLSYDDDEEEY